MMWRLWNESVTRFWGISRPTIRSPRVANRQNPVPVPRERREDQQPTASVPPGIPPHRPLPLKLLPLCPWTIRCWSMS